MDIEQYRYYCLSLNGVTEKFPFDQSTLVFYVMNKMFALTDVDKFEYINLKCDPDIAVELREQYSSVTPGFHMNKKHWNSVAMDHQISDDIIKKWIKDSYDLVVKKLTKKEKAALQELK